MEIDDNIDEIIKNIIKRDLHNFKKNLNKITLTLENVKIIGISIFTEIVYHEKTENSYLQTNYKIVKEWLRWQIKNGARVNCSAVNGTASGASVNCSAVNGTASGASVNCSAVNGTASGASVNCSAVNGTASGASVNCYAVNGTASGASVNCSAVNGTIDMTNINTVYNGYWLSWLLLEKLLVDSKKTKQKKKFENIVDIMLSIIINGKRINNVRKKNNNIEFNNKLVEYCKAFFTGSGFVYKLSKSIFDKAEDNLRFQSAVDQSTAIGDSQNKSGKFVSQSNKKSDTKSLIENVSTKQGFSASSFVAEHQRTSGRFLLQDIGESSAKIKDSSSRDQKIIDPRKEHKTFDIEEWQNTHSEEMLNRLILFVENVGLTFITNNMDIKLITIDEYKNMLYEDQVEYFINVYEKFKLFIESFSEALNYFFMNSTNLKELIIKQKKNDDSSISSVGEKSKVSSSILLKEIEINDDNSELKKYDYYDNELESLFIECEKNDDHYLKQTIPIPSNDDLESEKILMSLLKSTCITLK